MASMQKLLFAWLHRAKQVIADSALPMMMNLLNMLTCLADNIDALMVTFIT